jgi:D-sedoheptulose 7-phosphate isomerase
MNVITNYISSLHSVVSNLPVAMIETLAIRLYSAWVERRQIFICGNGGSAANAIHMANDLFYGAAKNTGVPGLASHALTANQAIVMCLANDFSYEAVFSEQLKAQGRPGDVLLALSGSGNSENIVQAILKARDLGMTTVAILGYDGGRCKELADIVIHVPVNDMQISEDVQLIVGHMLMQWLREKMLQNIW